MKINLTIGIPVWLDIICAWPLMVYRRRKYGYDFRRIYLGEGEWTILDQQDYYRLGNFKWWLKGFKTKCYAFRTSKLGPMKTRFVSLHREIMNPPKGLVVDHRNGDGLDNRRANLRLATHSQNMINRPKTKSKTTSKFVGVNFDKSRNKWAAKIHYENKKIWLGRFDSEIDAAKAYDEAAIKYHGEFARLNFTP
ncbi:MAG: AP2 domain-containing protein [Sedimentisphaerales bacterium]